MHFLDLATILCMGFMIGNELAVSVFVNPTLWELDEHARAKASSLLARSLGRIMPFWYTLSLILQIIEAYVRRRGATLNLLLVAIMISIAIIVYSVSALVPINNRIARLALNDLPAHWWQDHQKWDALHRWRILFLIVAMVFLTYGLLSAG
ncbi:MAG: DUF1772 domain-containing protein [Bryobacteraceae bacterium]